MSERELVFDVETYPTRDLEVRGRLEREALDRACPKTADRGVRLNWDTTESRQGRVDEAWLSTSLDVTLAEAVCITVGNASFLSGRSDEDERVLLEWASAEFERRSCAETVWVGHNIEGYDLGVLLNGWRRRGIRPPSNFPVYRRGRWQGRVYDTMLHIPSKSGYVSLEESCRLYGVKFVEVMWRDVAVDGSYVKALVDAGQWAILESYNTLDVTMETELWSVMTGGGAWGYPWGGGGVWDQVREIRGSNLGEVQKALSVVAALERAGLI